MTGSEETLKAVTNTDWGLPYLPRSALEQRRSDELMERREEVEEKTVPAQCRFIVAAVDVQGGKTADLWCKWSVTVKMANAG